MSIALSIIPLCFAMACGDDGGNGVVDTGADGTGGTGGATTDGTDGAGETTGTGGATGPGDTEGTDGAATGTGGGDGGGEPVAAVALELVAEGMTSPTLLREAPDDSGRLFVLDQVGTIRIVNADGELLPEPFLDLQESLVELTPSYDERGLLGLAFHPQYADNGRFYVYYSAPLREDAPDGWDHTARISEFTASADDANRADPESERVVLEVDQPQPNHNGGTVAFGPEGFLYVSLGDGGAANDVGAGHPPLGNGQDATTLLGSILRLDVEEMPYAIPEDNPFTARRDPRRDEIWAYGFRNPFRMSFDMGGERQLFLGDAGQNQWEEVDIVARGDNYGWNIREGLHCFDRDNPDDSPANCPDTGPYGETLVDPILEYPNAGTEGGIGLAVIGGFVYRGEAIPGLEGQYVFGDYSASEAPEGQLFAAMPGEDQPDTWTMRELRIEGRDDDSLGAFVKGLGQDADGELYVLTSERGGPIDMTGAVYRIAPGESD